MPPLLDRLASLNLALGLRDCGLVAGDVQLRLHGAAELGDEYAAQFSRAVQAKLDIARDEAAIAKTKRQIQAGEPVQ